jgi:hypothetical protein
MLQMLLFLTEFQCSQEDVHGGLTFRRDEDTDNGPWDAARGKDDFESLHLFILLWAKLLNMTRLKTKNVDVLGSGTGVTLTASKKGWPSPWKPIRVEFAAAITV